MVIKTTALDTTVISPNDTAFFFRVYSMRNTMPAYRLEQVQDFSYNYEFGTDTLSTRTTRGPRSTSVRTGDDTKELTFSTVESVSVEAHEIMRWAMKDNEKVEIWRVKPTVTSDGVTILDNNGTPVPVGWMPDEYWVGTINADSFSSNQGDSSSTHEWTISLEAFHDSSWVEPIEWTMGDSETYPNASLQAYTDTDNPNHTVRDTNVDEAQPSGNESQHADSAVTPPTPPTP